MATKPKKTMILVNDLIYFISAPAFTEIEHRSLLSAEGTSLGCTVTTGSVLFFAPSPARFCSAQL
jgi:hypothetical protein